MTPDELLNFDRAHVWHPYASMPADSASLLVSEANGVQIKLADGTWLIDGMSSWWAAIHGYKNRVLDEALVLQSQKMSHVMFGGLTHEPAIKLCKKLIDITPTGLDHVFLCDSGSVSVEVAIKMCLQYFRSVGQPSKRKLLTWRGGYHGDTFHPMSVCDPDGGMHSLWKGILPEQIFVSGPPLGFDAPVDNTYAQELDQAVEENKNELAAVIVEPVVQGAGGMRFHNPVYLKTLREVTSKHNVLLIFDEIATGFGRTGKLFGAEHAGVSPDCMCVGKALTGGYMTMAAALCSEQVAQGISSGEVPILAHGPTFMGNPLSCAVANASIELLEQCDWQGKITNIEKRLQAGLAPAQEFKNVKDVRVLGAIGVIELDCAVDMQKAQKVATAHGVWLRPFRNLIYTMPPYIIKDDELETVIKAMVAIAKPHTNL